MGSISPLKRFITLLCAATFLNSRADDLAGILGSPTNDWRIARIQGTPDDFKIGAMDGATVFSAGPNGIALTSLKPLTADTEVTVRFRFAPTGGKATTLYFFSGLSSPDEAGYNSLFMQLTVPAGAEQEQVNYQLTALPGQKAGAVGGYYLNNLPKERKTMPEMVRKRVEAEAAAQTPLAKRWLTLRCVIRKNDQQVWLDDRLLREAKGDLVKPEGNFRIQLYEGAHLASIRIRSLPPEDSLFETVSIDHYLNASIIKGDKVAQASLPVKSQNTGGDACATIQGVPFVWPRVDDRGNDHIAINRSWMQFGLLEGGFDGWFGETPRWRGAMWYEPGRIQLRIRNGQYNRLHLIAAYDGEPDTAPIVTAQFFRVAAGAPVNFAARVPLFTTRSSEAHAVPVNLTSGGKGNLYLVTIPLEPNGLASLSETDYVEMELTKEVRVYRAFPDPMYYSEHGAGLPSGVHVYALTMERPAVETDFHPDKFAHIWTAPEKPWYTVTLRNRTQGKQRVKLELTTVSHDGLEKTSQSTAVNLAAAAQDEVKLPITLKKYGYHDVQLRISEERGTRTETRSLAYLHPDTRERGGWEEGKGILWGFWDWYGGHVTPGGIPRLQVMVAAGAESSLRPMVTGENTPEELTFAEAHGMLTHFLGYQLKLTKAVLEVEPDLTKPAEMETALIAALNKSPMAKPTAVNKPELAVMFTEPHLGPVSYMSLPEYYGDPPYQMTAEEQTNYKKFRDEFLIMARAIKKTWPKAKCLMPWGLPLFPVPFLRDSKEATELMDGPALDMVLFERIPEMQIHQVTFASQLWQLKQEWMKTGKPWPKFTSIEGPCSSPATPGALTQEQEADHTVRAFLIQAAFGTTRQLGWPSAFRCASSWGEQHYGSGMIERLPLLTPKVFYSAYATMTRQLNRMNFVKALETGSTSVFCLQFKHYKTGELLHVFWTLRGKRSVSLDIGGIASVRASEARTEPRSPSVQLYDSMDNAAELKSKDGKATFTISASPCYFRGLTADAEISLGTPDHSDSKPSKDSARLGNPGDGSWKLSTETDSDYENVHLEFVKKFPGKMSVQSVASPKEQGGKALSVHLEEQEKERRTMPFYTTLAPEQPIVIPGKASHLGLWVRAASDWGRVVYCMRDANGERWLSVGKKGEWNVDDVHCWSAFCFDGWRYLRFEMPGNEPWDCYRDAGTTFWGYYGKGDGIADLPLTLEKIILERRTHVIQADELKPANPEDVLIGELFAEYEKPEDKTDEAVRLSRLRMELVEPAAAPATGKPKSAEEQNPFH
ncbi:MAG: hypothetical protein HY360_26350 [Verrucomicrobia bacterium]|nr:hypothetical protein [Verrucomicrobiota bacterium]